MDAIRKYLRPLIKRENFQHIRTQRYIHNSWDDIDKFLSICILKANKFSNQELSKSFDFQILLQCKNASFVSEEHKSEIESLISRYHNTKESPVPDAVTIYLKPLISEEEYKDFRSKDFCKSSWHDITQLMYSLLTFAERVAPKNLRTSLVSSIVLKCRDAHFLTQKQIPRIEALVQLSNKNSAVKVEIKAHPEIAIIQEDDDLVSDLARAVRNKGKEKGYYNTDGTIAFRTILLKRLHLCLSADRRGLDFNLDDDDIKNLLERKTCYYTGARFSNSENYRRTIDRIDNKKGYVKGNVVACTHGINQIKNLILEDTSNYLITPKQLQKFSERLSKDL